MQPWRTNRWLRTVRNSTMMLNQTTGALQLATRYFVFSPVVTGRRADKLGDHWQGPYEILGRDTPVTYLVDMPERHKRHRTVHVEAMKLWVESTLPIHYVRPETEPQYDLPDYHSSTELALEGIRHSLPPDQLTQLITLLRSLSLFSEASRLSLTPN